MATSELSPTALSRLRHRLHRVWEKGRSGSHAARGRGLTWRLVTPLAFVAAGVLMVASAISSGGTDLRPGRYENLADLARQQSDRVQSLRAEVAALNEEITQLSGSVTDRSLTRLQSEIDALKVPAGLTAVQGPGLVVTLDDAPEAVRDSAGEQLANTIVHQQDIQAVVNALWAGGAEAMTIQGQRVISTTGIKCVGNTVILHGVPYSPPYVISAIGSRTAMESALSDSPYIRAYLNAVEEWQVGWQVRAEDSVAAPAYDGSTDLRYVTPAGDPT